MCSDVVRQEDRCRPVKAGQPVIVAGMHRSGTSLTASLLSALSLDLGREMVAPDSNNPRGYFEDVDFVELQRKILATCCAADADGHRDWGWTPGEQLNRERIEPFRSAAQALLDVRLHKPDLWGWKDPRTTLLLDFWDELLAGDARYVLVYRFPWDVADSMQRLGEEVFLRNPEYAYRIWAYYNRHLLDFYARHADRCLLVSVNALRGQLPRFASLLADKLGLAASETCLAPVFDNNLFQTVQGNDPLIPLVAQVWPDCTRLLGELDDMADISASGLWDATPRRSRMASGEARDEGRPASLSVITPCYNQGALLVEAIASVERFAPADSELIIVNDGSRDARTLEILDIVRRNGYRVIDQQNMGLSAARNTGIAHARGSYVLPLDDDNRIRAGFAQQAVQVLDSRPEIGVVYGDRYEFGLRNGVQKIPEFDATQLLMCNYIDACAIFRRQVWVDCNGYDVDMPVLEDWEFWIHATKLGWGFHHLDAVTLDYRVRPGSLVSKIAHVETCETAWKRVWSRHADAYKKIPDIADELWVQVAEIRANTNAQIEQLSNWGRGLEARLGAADELVIDRGMEIEHLSKWGQALDARLQAADQLVMDRGAEIKRLSGWAHGLDVRLREAEALAIGRTAEIDRLSAWGHELQGRLADSEILATGRGTEISRLSSQVQELERLRQNVDSQLALIRRSRSWRLTKPLRFLGRMLRHGLQSADREALFLWCRDAYRRIPVPEFLKRRMRVAFFGVFGAAPAASPLQVVSVVCDAAGTDLTESARTLAAQIPGMPDYIFWGVIDWHFRHQRPQHLAQTLAASGRRVFYVSAHLTDREGAGFEVEPLDDSGRLFQIRLFARGAPVIYTAAPGAETVRQLRADLGEILLWAETGALISVVQHPFWYDVASVMPDARLVYDCMDHHEGFGNTGTDIMALERALLKESDLTIVTSAWLYEAVAAQAPRRALIRNAGEYAHFASPPAEIFRDPEGRRVIGYYGAIAEWFDQDLIAATAERFPECLVLLVGADTANAQRRLGGYPNVAFVPEVPYAKLSYYLYGFDVCLLPFKIIPLTLATNPVKVYEYLSAGKPVVAVDLPEMSQFGDLVRVAADPETFLDAVASVVGRADAAGQVEQRQAFARGQTWQHRIEDLIEVAEADDLTPATSVVVVAYNNIGVTQACLASLERHSPSRQQEVIVVDNASSDGTPEFLRAWAEVDPDRRRLILNPDNRGFAAANNQGLAVARGDYLVLLNNDTYVTPGWANTLAGHLRRDKTIGLIGPVTNNIGNEARIDIAYADMTEMIAAATKYTHRHIGALLPLRTAAFFCVAFRREVYQAVGDLDEAFGLGFFEDDDYCRRVEEKGWRIVCAEDVFVHHHLSASFDQVPSPQRRALFERNKAIYEAKWGAWLPHVYRQNS